jgi:AIR synthase related protein, C-terminal domain
VGWSTATTGGGAGRAGAGGGGNGGLFTPVAQAALAAGIGCATDVTGFGLLGLLFKLAPASSVSAVVDHAAVPPIEGTRAAARAGHIPGGSRRNPAWVRPHTDPGGVREDDLLLLADAQTSGGLLVAGELPGAPVIGELTPRRDSILIIASRREPLRHATGRGSLGRPGPVKASRRPPPGPDRNGGGRRFRCRGQARTGEAGSCHLLPRRGERLPGPYGAAWPVQPPADGWLPGPNASACRAIRSFGRCGARRKRPRCAGQGIPGTGRTCLR